MTTKIAIDGPAGAGKSTIARRIAGALSFIYVDTGAMYRAMAVHLLREGVAPDDTKAVEESCRRADITIAYENGEQQVFLNGGNVTPYLRREETGNMASVCAANSEVRRKLVSLQKELASRENVVMDGRDIGTVVLPDADVKIYLTASIATRAKRRCQELLEKGVCCQLADVEKDIRDRDYQDMHREISPLRQAEDAVLVDSSDLTIEQVTERILAICREKKEGSA